MVLQLLPRYVIKDKLMLLLESNFGRQDFTVTVSHVLKYVRQTIR